MNIRYLIIGLWVLLKMGMVTPLHAESELDRIYIPKKREWLAYQLPQRLDQMLKQPTLITKVKDGVVTDIKIFSKEEVSQIWGKNKDKVLLPLKQRVFQYVFQQPIAKVAVSLNCYSGPQAEPVALTNEDLSRIQSALREVMDQHEWAKDMDLLVFQVTDRYADYIPIEEKDPGS